MAPCAPLRAGVDDTTRQWSLQLRAMDLRSPGRREAHPWTSVLGSRSSSQPYEHYFVHIFDYSIAYRYDDQCVNRHRIASICVPLPPWPLLVPAEGKTTSSISVSG